MIIELPNRKSIFVLKAHFDSSLAADLKPLDLVVGLEDLAESVAVPDRGFAAIHELLPPSMVLSTHDRHLQGFESDVDGYRRVVEALPDLGLPQLVDGRDVPTYDVSLGITPVGAFTEWYQLWLSSETSSKGGSKPGHHTRRSTSSTIHRRVSIDTATPFLPVPRSSASGPSRLYRTQLPSQSWQAAVEVKPSKSPINPPHISVESTGQWLRLGNYRYASPAEVALLNNQNYLLHMMQNILRSQEALVVMFHKHFSRHPTSSRTKTHAKARAKKGKGKGKGKQPQKSHHEIIPDSNDEESSYSSHGSDSNSHPDNDVGLSQDETWAETLVDTEEPDQQDRHIERVQPLPRTLIAAWVHLNSPLKAPPRWIASSSIMMSTYIVRSARVATAFKQAYLATTEVSTSVPASAKSEPGSNNNAAINTVADTAAQSLQKLDKKALVSLFLEFCSRRKRSLAAIQQGAAQPAGYSRLADNTTDKERPYKRARPVTPSF
ncbi:hypothetical protein VE02_06273 [Pseudogymnoascus sp. 03VT05]|nr:hypothetical protein VE02_06273 [Pseudogymnoascus sp. 03VT05]